MSEYITPGIEHPPNRSLFKELSKIEKARIKFAPEDYALEAKYGPQYNRLDINKAGENLMGYTDDQGVYHPGTAALGRAGAQIQRAGDVSDVLALGPQATRAILASNPFLAASLQNLSGRTADSPILQMLNQQALGGLQQGGQLSPQDVRQSDQAARAAFSARGLVSSSPAAAAEILNRDAAVRQRLAGAQQFATGVQGLNQQQAEQVARASQVFSGTLSDPFQAILGRPSLGATAALPGGGPAGRTFAPQDYMQYGQDLFNTNYNAGVNLGIANANNQAATRAAIASIAGSSIGSDERIKTEIRDTGEKTATGIPIKTWRYIHDPLNRRWRGVIAQDVEKVIPHAVFTDPITGIKSVDYHGAGAVLKIVSDKE
jgi:Chaperone of endosialidase